jgi:pilus assembly protein Flp/PilA
MSMIVYAANRLFKDRSGVTAIEYGLIASLIAIAIIVAIKLVGTNLNDTFNTVASNLYGVVATPGALTPSDKRQLNRVGRGIVDHAVTPRARA